MERDAVLLLGQRFAAFRSMHARVLFDYFAALIFSLSCFDVLNFERHDLLLVGTLLDGVAVLFFLI